MFYIAKQYARLYAFIRDTFNINIRGLGVILRQIRGGRVLPVAGRQLWFSDKVAASYARPILGEWNEPETHLFLNYIVPRLSGTCLFVDVGANIGEMVVDVSRHANVTQIVAFEPISECCVAIRKSIALNEIKNCIVIEKLVGDSCGDVCFLGDASNSVGSSVYSVASATAVVKTSMTTLDSENYSLSDYSIFLIDVEGYEPRVLRGAEKLIRERQPIIVFEYNEISKKYFDISEIQEILGVGYCVYRLRTDGRLDSNVQKSWNCVAVPVRLNASGCISEIVLTNEQC